MAPLPNSINTLSLSPTGISSKTTKEITTTKTYDVVEHRLI